MKKINPILLTTIILILTSCSNKWHIVRREDKLNNLKNWKADRMEKKEVKKDNVAKFK